MLNLLIGWASPGHEPHSRNYDGPIKLPYGLLGKFDLLI